MLTEGDVFPNLAGLTAGELGKLTLQERARLRVCPYLMSPSDVISLRTGEARSNPDAVQRIVHDFG